MLCCVCLLENPCNMDIFNEIGRELKIADIISKYLWLKPTPNNTSTKEICTNCWHKIEDFHVFYETVEKAHKEFEQKATCTIKREESCVTPIKLEQEANEEIINTTIETIDGIEMLNPLEDNYASDKSFRDVSDEEKFETSDEYEPSIASCQESDLEDKTQMNEMEVSDEDKTKSRKAKGKRKNNATGKDKVIPIKRKKKVVMPIDQKLADEMVLKHITMGCDLCVYVGTNFNDIVEHFRSAHADISPYIRCCGRKLSRNCHLSQHALTHEDPNYFRCEECNKSFTKVRGLRTHNLTYHADEEDKIYACIQCPQKFALKYLLELHNSTHIPKEQWEYSCKICPDKTFPNRHHLNIHECMRHKREANICPVCAKEYKGKTSYEKHVRLHYEDSGPRVKCTFPNCDSWLKDEENLKIHLKMHYKVGLFKCDECDKECTNNRALRSHKRYAHSNIKYQCEQCDKTFKKPITLREHMTQHTGETLYKCPFCTKTFNSNANMHAHKKKQHPLEWEEWRKNKRGSSQKLINNSNPLNKFDDGM